MINKPIIILTGPTSVGKTAVALKLARRMPLRIISADSMQVYRRMDIGTAKPTPAEREAVPHYGLDLADPNKPYSTAEYLAVALQAIAETREAGLLPLVVGGTRLYLQAVAGHYEGSSPPLLEFRARLMAQAEDRGAESLHRELAVIDPPAAARIHSNDLKRIIRALEVYEATGKTISQFQDESRQAAPRTQAITIALVRDREEIYRGVEKRTEAMIGEGWLEEVDGLLRDGYGPGLEAIKAHGYRELAAYLQGTMTLPDAVTLINRNVRRYVRYQLGWIRQMQGAHVVDAEGPVAALAGRLMDVIESSGYLS